MYVFPRAGSPTSATQIGGVVTVCEPVQCKGYEAHTHLNGKVIIVIYMTHTYVRHSNTSSIIMKNPLTNIAYIGK